MGSNGRFIGTPRWVREFGVWVRKPVGRLPSKRYAYIVPPAMWRSRPLRAEPCDKHRRKHRTPAP